MSQDKVENLCPHGAGGRGPRVAVPQRGLEEADAESEDVSVLFARTVLTFIPSPKDLRQAAWDEVRSPAHTFLMCEDETLALWPK